MLKSELQRSVTHHTAEIKRLINTQEEYKHENIALLKKELAFFIDQLESIK